MFAGATRTVSLMGQVERGAAVKDDLTHVLPARATLRGETRK